MPLLFIHATNAEFESRDDGVDYDTPEQALAAGVESAIGIVAEEVQNGLTSAAIEVSIEQADGTVVCRSVVTLCVAPLFTDKAARPAAA